MKIIMVPLVSSLLALLVLVPAPIANADSYPNGYTTPAGYTYNTGDGHWYNGGIAYRRSQIYYPSTYSYHLNNGCYSYTQNPSTYYYSYSLAYPATYSAPSAPAYTPPATPQYGTGWRAQLLDLARARDKVEGEMRKADLDHRAYLDAIQALGLNGNFRWSGYGNYSVTPRLPLPLIPGYQPSYPLSYQPNYSGQTGYSYGAQYNYGAPLSANTVYGYSVNSLRDQYGTTDLNLLYQQAARLTQNAQSLAGQAGSDFSGLVGDAGNNAARVAEILSRARAAQIALEAANLPPSSRTVTSSSGTVTGGTAGSSLGISGGLGGGIPPMNPVEGLNGAARALPGQGNGGGGNPALFLQAVGTPRCSSCHSGKDAKKGFDIANYTLLDPDQKRVVWKRILSEDPKVVMPPPPNQPLTSAEIDLFLRN